MPSIEPLFWANLLTEHFKYIDNQAIEQKNNVKLE